MRSLVASGVAVLVAASGGAAYSDPASPQVAPTRGSREDAQRLEEPLRDLDRDAAGPGAVPPAPAIAPTGDPRQADASACLDRGVAAYRARDFARAIGELVAASRLLPGWPDPYHWLALAQAASDDCPSAVINIDAFAARVGPGDRRLAELSALRDRCLATGVLRVDAEPAGATIRIDDGPPVGTTSQRLTLRTGVHTVTVEKPGFEPGSQRVEVDPLGARYASFQLSAVHDRPLTLRWWVWAAVGVATVVVVGLAVEATQHSDRGLGVTCDLSGCHP